MSIFNNNPFYSYWLIPPFLPNNFTYPPRLVDIMQAMVNYENKNPVLLSNLAKEASSKVFNFNYPLSENIDKTEFEENILEHFITRRIGFETFAVFQIKLKNKLREIMPMYNSLFDATVNWNVFKDGYTETRNSTDNRTSNNTISSDVTQEGNIINDNRNSEMPQNDIGNVQDGNYLTDYSYNTQDSNNTTNSTSTNNLKDDNTHNETITHTIDNKSETYIKMLQAKETIYKSIYNNLECLFFQVLD